LGAAAVYGDFGQIRVFPNPWRMDRNSTKMITFDQMPVGTTVKIFTVSGRWVATLDGTSGTAVWNLNNQDGEPVATGYYIYLATTDAGGKQRGIVGVIK